MKVKNFLTVMLSTCFVMSSLVACGSDQVNDVEKTETKTTTVQEVEEKNEKETPLIGYSLNSMDSTMKAMADYFEISAIEKGWEPVLQNANGDVGTELNNVESLINMGCDVIMIMGCDTEGSAAAVEACSNAGIPAIICGRAINTDEKNYYSYIAGDHHLAGIVQGTFINDYLKENQDEELKIAFLYGQSGSASVAARYQGFEDTCINGEYSDRIELVASQYAEFDAEKAYNITTDMLTTYPEINCFVTQTDDQAGGIINAIKAQGLNMEDYLIVSIDCSETGQNYLESGELDATVLMAMKQLAVTSAVYADKAMNGEIVEKSNSVPNYYQLTTPDTYKEVMAANGME